MHAFHYINTQILEILYYNAGSIEFNCQYNLNARIFEFLIFYQLIIKTNIVASFTYREATPRIYIYFFLQATVPFLNPFPALSIYWTFSWPASPQKTVSGRGAPPVVTCCH